MIVGHREIIVWGDKIIRQRCNTMLEQTFPVCRACVHLAILLSSDSSLWDLQWYTVWRRILCLTTKQSSEKSVVHQSELTRLRTRYFCVMLQSCYGNQFLKTSTQEELLRLHPMNLESCCLWNSCSEDGDKSATTHRLALVVIKWQ